MSSIKKGTWCVILIIGVLSALTCEFTDQLTYLHVAVHLVLLTVIHFSLVFPLEDLLDGLGLTLYDLFTLFYDPEEYGFIEYVCKRQALFRVFVASYPTFVSAYFVHGQFFMEEDVSRFPPLLDNPNLWSVILISSSILTVAYYFYIRDYTKWSFYQYFLDNPECLEPVRELILDADTFRIRFSQRAYLYCTREYFVYVSNWRFIAVKQADLRLQVDATRMPMIPNQEDEERLRYIFVKVSFRPTYLPTFTLSLRHDFYRQINEILVIPIIVPPHIYIPLTIMEELKEDFIERIAQNDRHSHHIKEASDREPCFACGTEDNIIKIVKTCANNTERWQWNREGQRVYTSQCEPCVCRPLWCNRCIAQIFIGKQNIDDIYRHDYWRGTSQCPTCRKCFCVRDVHLVDFVLEEN
ncbi:unnamed protein product [Caenorhabditis sp. 36 PRJEB53466]|nr:unnamed protein product [Caenorhabditis sp. 36 PRJEB53466]